MDQHEKKPTPTLPYYSGSKVREDRTRAIDAVVLAVMSILGGFLGAGALLVSVEVRAATVVMLTGPVGFAIAAGGALLARSSLRQSIGINVLAWVGLIWNWLVLVAFAFVILAGILSLFGAV